MYEFERKDIKSEDLDVDPTQVKIACVKFKSE